MVTPTMVPYADLEREKQARISAQQQYNREKERRIQVEKQLELERNLWRTKFKPAEKLIIPELQRQIDRPVLTDKDGFSRFCYATAAINIGMSGKAPKRAIEKIIQQCPNLPIETKTVEEYDEKEGRKIPRLYIRATQNLIQAAATTEISAPIKQGGNQYQCNKCLSHDVTIIRRIHCNVCHHEVDLDAVNPNGKLQNQKNTGNNSRTNLVLEDDDKKNMESDANLSSFLKPVTPPIDDNLSTDPVEKNVQETESPVDLRAAAELLLDLAGDADVHIEMSRTGESKYYTVARRLTLDDMLSHLRGKQARGGQCSRSDGKTRGLGWDADDPETWEKLQEAARQLAAAGYFPILEWSPADRGGHLWVIYSDLIDLAAARRHVHEIAPLLESIKEYWPGPANVKWNRVRLPGGKYVRYGKYVEHPVNAWCELVSVVDGESSRNGQVAAALLLSHQSPIELVPVLDECEIVLADPEREIWEVPDASEFALAGEGTSKPRAEHEIGNVANVAPPAGDDQGQTALEKRTLPVVDPTWVAKYGDVATTKLWFAISEERSATWFNENHSLDEIRPRERNGMALSPNGSERSASTSYRNTSDGERYTDFSTHGRRANGQHDTGDVLELAVKVWERSKASLLTETAKEINDQARSEMEAAARSGSLPPAWIQELMTPAGWSRYDWVLASKSSPAGESPATIPVRATVGKIVPVERKKDAPPTTTGGVTGFHSDSQLTTPIVTDIVAVGLQNSALAVPHSKEERIEQLAQELGVPIGVPCVRCGCTIQRDLCGDWVCLKCYPTKGLGDDAWERLRILFPVRRSL